MAVKTKPATDGALGGVISALTGGGGMTGTGAAIGTSIGGPIGGVIGGGVGLLGDIFGAMSDDDNQDVEALNKLRSSREWIDWE